MSILGDPLVFGSGSSGDDTFAFISVTYPAGSTCTATNGTKTLTAPDTSGTVVFRIPEPVSLPESWTINCTDYTDSTYEVVSITHEGQSDDLILHYNKIYGVSWDGTSTTRWTRTDDAAGFTDPVPYISGANSYGSPFDNLYPWSDMTIVEDAEAGTMVKIPKFWYNLTQDGNSIKIQIASKANSGFSVCPACMDRGDGKGEHNYILVGRYKCASDYKSKSGVTPKTNTSRINFRSNIKSLGNSIHQIDFATRFTIWLLYLVEYADWNSQVQIGYGCGNNSSLNTMGYTDSMPYHTGTTMSSRTNYASSTQYRNIEGLWDNCYEFLDGCYNNSSGFNIILNPSKYSDNSNGALIGKPVSGFPSKLSVKTISNTFPMFIPTAITGTSTPTAYTADTWIYDTTNNCVLCGGNYTQTTNVGLFYMGRFASDSGDSKISTRPMKFPS